MSEQWKAIPGFDGRYEASTLGRIRTVEHRILTMRTATGSEYPKVSLIHDPTQPTFKTRSKAFPRHRLVALTFIGPCPSGYEVNHINGDKNDARAENLEYVTRSENMLHVHRTLKTSKPRKGTAHYKAKFTDTDIVRIRQLRAEGMIYKDIAAQYGVRLGTIMFICNGQTWKHVLMPT